MDDDGAPGVPEWVVTYGDMMSLLLTFFIMLVSLSEVVADKKYRAILDALQQYTGYRTGPLAPPGKSFPLNSMLLRLETLGSHTNQEKGRGGVKQEAVVGAERRVLRTRDGQQIQVGSTVHFQPETASLAEDSSSSVTELAELLAGKPNKIVITATVTYRGDRPDGAAIARGQERVMMITRQLKQKSIDENRIRVSLKFLALAEPIPEQQARAGEEVKVFLLDTHTSELVGPTEIPE